MLSAHFQDSSHLFTFFNPELSLWQVDCIDCSGCDVAPLSAFHMHQAHATAKIHKIFIGFLLAPEGIPLSPRRVNDRMQSQRHVSMSYRG